MPDPVARTSASSQTPPAEPLPPEAPKLPPEAPAASGSLSLAAQQLVERHLAGAPSVSALLTDERVQAWYRDKLFAEGACLLPCGAALRAAELEMPDEGLAERMMDHFLSGASSPVHVNLNAELERNPQLREYVASRIESEITQAWESGKPLEEVSGAIWVPQGAYGPSNAGRDQRLGLGGTYLEYQVAGSAQNAGLEVRVNISDHYFWSPSERARATHCLHECGASLVGSGKAYEFHQVGEGTLIVADPSRCAPMTKLEVESHDNG